MKWGAWVQGAYLKLVRNTMRRSNGHLQSRFITDTSIHPLWLSPYVRIYVVPSINRGR